MIKKLIFNSLFVLVGLFSPGEILREAVCGRIRCLYQQIVAWCATVLRMEDLFSAKLVSPYVQMDAEELVFSCFCPPIFRQLPFLLICDPFL